MLPWMSLQKDTLLHLDRELVAVEAWEVVVVDMVVGVVGCEF